MAPVSLTAVISVQLNSTAGACEHLTVSDVLAARKNMSMYGMCPIFDRGLIY